MNQAPLLPAEDYRALFEHTPLGAEILAELERKFSLKPVTTGGIDAVLETYLRMGQRSVIDFIALRINQANQVPYLEPDEE
ncbi:hypothetical protein [Pigmentiphaga sp. CHJ604]|uniref:Bbp19 family protein n=1 Tax=Pigmentiphaga sp. CHJ604 TaxID=3081984 RepID=UPI0030CEA754